LKSCSKLHDQLTILEFAIIKCRFMDPKLSISLILTICAFVLTLYLSVVVIIQSDVAAGGASSSVSASVPVQQQEIEHPGQKIFKANCNACHRIHQKLIGPALAGVLERRDSLWVVKMIRNSAQLIASGDPTAVQLFREYNGIQMTSFTSLSDEELRILIEYLKVEGERQEMPLPDSPRVEV
jgi:mono/diheme cytochrome c family protein